MKKLEFITIILFLTMIHSIAAQDIIILRDGNVIEAKVMEIYPSDIRYKRFDNLDGPMIIILKDSVLSIRYENGTLDIFNPSSVTSQGREQTNSNDSDFYPQSGVSPALQIILNALPAVPIAGNNLKFLFDGDQWKAAVNGENFSAGTIGFEITDNGAILTLKQTHIWPGAVGRTAGRIANLIPGGSAVGSALNTAGAVAGAAGAIEAAGPEIILEYSAGPPARLSLVRSTMEADTPPDNNQMTTDGVHPLLASNRFDLDGLNVFAISLAFMPTYWWSYGGGITFTLYEQYKPNTFFTPSYFLSGKFYYNFNDNNDSSTSIFTVGVGVLFKHRFPGERVLWNLGASLEFMGASAYNYYDEGNSFLFGIGIQTGFSFRLNPYTSLEIGVPLKIPFGSVKLNYGGSLWPSAGGIELGVTFWTPFKSRR